MNSGDTTIPVRWDTYVRAQSDAMFKSYADLGGFGKFFHIRQPSPIDEQNVIRMNRDTLYSLGIFDLTSPVTVTLPDVGDRYMSLMIVNQDMYDPAVVYAPGEFTFTRDDVGTRYALFGVRTLVDSGDPDDIKAVNGIQDQIKVDQASAGTFEIPDWDQDGLKELTDALNVVANTMLDYNGCFGAKDEVDPFKHVLGASSGWGGLPMKAAMYATIYPDHNDGTTPQVLTVKDVPVDGFWSITVYNKDGYLEKNPAGVYVVNDRNAVRGADGSITIHFGGDPSQPNHLYITDGWNYAVRQYQPQQPILDGSWIFPKPTLA